MLFLLGNKPYWHRLGQCDEGTHVEGGGLETIPPSCEVCSWEGRKRRHDLIESPLEMSYDSDQCSQMPDEAKVL